MLAEEVSQETNRHGRELAIGKIWSAPPDAEALRCCFGSRRAR
jgi:hypothetical protein